MNLFALNLAYLRYRPLQATLHVLLFAFGIATMTIILLTTAQLQSKTYQQVNGIDVMVDAAGTPLLIGIGFETLYYVGLFLVAFSGIGMFGLLFTALSERRYDMAILRALGARPSTIGYFLIQEGLMLSALGTLLGIVLGHATVSFIGHWLQAAGKIGPTGHLWLVQEWWIVLGGLGVGVVASLLPAWRAGKSNIAQVLNH